MGPFQWGKVGAVHTTAPFTPALGPNVDVYLDGSATLTTGLYYLASYAPQVNDIVAVARMQGQAKAARFVLGTLGLLGTPTLGTLGYAQIVASQVGITTQVDITGLTVTVTVGTGRRIRISAFTPALVSTVATDEGEIHIMEGATELSHVDLQQIGQAGGGGGTCSVVLTPTVGSHTYKVQAVRGAGTGSITWSAAATYPSYILVEDIGT